MPEPAAACFPPSSMFFSSCWMSRLERPQGVNSHQLHKRSYTTIIIFCAWSRGKQKPRVQSCLEHQAWPISWFTTNKFEKSALMLHSYDFLGCCPTNMQLHYLNLFDYIWLIYGDSSLPVQVSCMWSMQSNACILMVSVISHSGVSMRFHFCFSVIFCVRSVFCKPARWIYINLPHASILKFES